MTRGDPFVSRARTLPVAPRPVSGESFHSWVVRISAASRTSLDLILQRMGIYEPNPSGTVPYGYGVALDDRTLARVAAVTEVAPDVVESLLLVPTYGALFDTSVLDHHRADTFRQFGAKEWVYLVGSQLCPRCLDERKGAWRLLWRLPWCFACGEHRSLLLDTCPKCAWVIGGGRRDHRTGPAFLSKVHTPTRCMNRPPYGMSTPGLTSEACGQDLTELNTVALRPDSILLHAQAHITAVLSSGQAPEPWGEDLRSYFGDLRALVAIFLIPTDPSLVPRLVRADLPLACLEALTAQARRQDEAIAARGRVIDSGGSPRAGPRLRTWSKAPRDTPLLAATTTAALRVLERGDLNDLAAIHAVDKNLLGSKLRSFHPSLHLVRLVELLLRRRNFSRSLEMHSRRGVRAPTARLKPQHIPWLCWEPVWVTYFEGPCQRAKIMERAGRQFVSLCLMKRVTGAGWGPAGAELGMAAKTAAAMAHRCVQRLSRVDAVQGFGDALVALFRYLDGENTPLVDYACRRRRFEFLADLPTDCLASPSTLSDNARSYYAPASLWALLTGGSAIDAPSMQRCPLKSKNDLYRYFRRWDLPAIRDDLTAAAAKQCRLAPYETEAPLLEVVEGEAFDVDRARYTWLSTHSLQRGAGGVPLMVSNPLTGSGNAGPQRRHATERRAAMKALLQQGFSTSQVGRRFGVSAQRVHQVVGSRAVPTLHERRVLALMATHGTEVQRLFYRLRDDEAVANGLHLDKKYVRICIDRTVPDASVLRRFPLTRADPYSDGEVLRCLAEASDDLGGRLTVLKYNAWARHRFLPDGRRWPLHQLAVTRFGGWHVAVTRARASRVHPRGEQFEMAVSSVTQAWRELGRPPSAHEYDVWRKNRLDMPSPTTIRRAAGGWNELLVAAWTRVHSHRGAASDI